MKADKGERTGSCSAPIIYKIFIGHLLKMLKEAKVGVHLMFEHPELLIAVLAYSDDLLIMVDTAADFQSIINICETFSDDWRFSFHIIMIKCTVSIFNSNANYQFFLYGALLAQRKEFIYLGNVVSNDSHQDRTIVRFLGKADRRLNRLSDIKMWSLLPIEFIKMIYQQKIQSFAIVFAQCISLSHDITTCLQDFQQRAISDIIGDNILDKGCEADMAAGRLFIGIIPIIGQWNIINVLFFMKVLKREHGYLAKRCLLMTDSRDQEGSPRVDILATKKAIGATTLPNGLINPI